jgi:hypothetical protein
VYLHTDLARRALISVLFFFRLTIHLLLQAFTLRFHVGAGQATDVSLDAQMQGLLYSILKLFQKSYAVRQELLTCRTSLKFLMVAPRILSHRSLMGLKYLL